MDGHSLAAKFSFITNRLKYCGPNDSYLKFLQYLKTNDEPLKKEIQNRIERFEGLYSYLNVISKKANLDLLDYMVVEAYWLGNELLDIYNQDDLKKIISSLSERGLPKSYARKLSENLPEGMAPHHSFNVVYVGVGKVTGSVKTNLENINNCLIRAGEIVKISGKNLLVKNTLYIYKNKRLVPGDIIESKAEFLPEFFDDIKKGDIIALHWNFAVTKITKEQKANLEKYTKKNIDALNSAT